MLFISLFYPLNFLVFILYPLDFASISLFVCPPALQPSVPSSLFPLARLYCSDRGHRADVPLLPLPTPPLPSPGVRACGRAGVCVRAAGPTTTTTAISGRGSTRTSRCGNFDIILHFGPSLAHPSVLHQPAHTVWYVLLNAPGLSDPDRGFAIRSRSRSCVQIEIVQIRNWGFRC